MSRFALNDIPVRKCIAVASVLLAATVILLFMRAAGYEIPFFTQAVGLIFAGFAPGSLLLRILKLHNLGMARTLLYAVGLSIAFLMAVGFVLNSLFPFIGVSRPLDPLPILCGVAAGTLVLCGLVYVRDRSFTPPPPHGRIQITPVKIALLLPPLLAVLGAQLVNVRDNNLLLMFLIGGLSLVPVIAVLTKRLPESLFPWVILSLALALLLHRTMITDRLWGADIVREFACYRTVALNGVWQASAPNLIPAYNTSLAVTVLPAMFANLTGIDGLWVFKFVFPLLLALVPVAMYEAARTRFPKRTAFLAVFLTISGYLFYTTCPGVAKQLIATVFLTLFLLTLVDRRLASPAREIMLAVFGLGVVTSHYSTAFMFAIMVVAAIVVKLVLGRRHRVLATAVPMALIVVVTAAWYLLLADGAVIKQFLGMGNTAVTAPAATPATGAPAGTESVRLISEGSTNLPGSLRALYLVTQGFMVVGAATGFLRWLLRRGPPGSDEYMTFAACFSGLLGLELVLPQFSLVISLDRIYPMALIVLAPFCITSVEMTVAVVSLLVKRSRRSLACLYGRLVRVRRESAFALGTAGVFLMVYLLANSGFLYEIAGRPLVEWVVDAFRAAHRIGEIAVVIPTAENLGGWVDRVDKLVVSNRDFMDNAIAGAAALLDEIGGGPEFRGP